MSRQQVRREALHDVSGAPHGFHYEKRLLYIGFTPWVFCICPAYRIMYVSKWNRPVAIDTSDIVHLSLSHPNLSLCDVIAVLRGEECWDARGGFLQFGKIDDGHKALRMLDGPSWSVVTSLHVGLPRLPAMHLNRLCRQAYE